MSPTPPSAVAQVLGGVGAAGKAVSQVPLGSEMFPFAQRACLDFLGNKEQVLSLLTTYYLLLTTYYLLQGAGALARSRSLQRQPPPHRATASLS